jgi:trehalose 6-phosphate phosphatase
MGLEFNHVDMELADRFVVPDLRQCALLLDIDGTILDLAPAPDEVRVPAELRDTLSRLEELTAGALALISGRLLRDIDLIFSPLQLAAVGGHGAELRVVPGGEAVTRARELNPVLKRQLATLTEIGSGILVEDKGYSLALHYRLAPDKGDVLRAAIKDICAAAPRGSVEILPGKLVFEIKMTGINKAGAVRELMKYPPFKGRKPIFIGDDTTDEPVFPILSQFGGLGFSVGRVVADVNGHFEKPESVRAWLSRIANNGQGKGQGTSQDKSQGTAL